MCCVAVVSSSTLEPYSACVVYLREIEAFEFFVAGSNNTHTQDVLLSKLTSDVKAEVSHSWRDVDKGAYSVYIHQNQSIVIL